MEKSYKNIHLLLHDIYIEGGLKISPYANQLNFSARMMYEKTKIHKELKRANELRELTDYLMSLNDKGKSLIEHRFLAHKILTECHEVITDDLLLLSAYELHSKAKLLNKGYTVHLISNPNNLTKIQKSKPIHVRTIRAAASKNETIKFQENSIGIGHLVQTNYRDKTKTPENVLKGIQEVRNRRNLVHFNSGFMWSVSKELLEFVCYLENNIPKYP